jgi:hypothetical protein
LEDTAPSITFVSFTNLWVRLLEESAPSIRFVPFTKFLVRLPAKSMTCATLYVHPFITVSFVP